MTQTLETIERRINPGPDGNLPSSPWRRNANEILCNSREGDPTRAKAVIQAGASWN